MIELLNHIPANGATGAVAIGLMAGLMIAWWVHRWR